METRRASAFRMRKRDVALGLVRAVVSKWRDISQASFFASRMQNLLIQSSPLSEQYVLQTRRSAHPVRLLRVPSNELPQPNR